MFALSYRIQPVPSRANHTFPRFFPAASPRFCGFLPGPGGVYSAPESDFAGDPAYFPVSLLVLCNLTGGFFLILFTRTGFCPGFSSAYVVPNIRKIINIQNATVYFLWYSTSVEVVPLGFIAAGILLMPWQ